MSTTVKLPGNTEEDPYDFTKEVAGTLVLDEDGGVYLVTEEDTLVWLGHEMCLGGTIYETSTAAEDTVGELHRAPTCTVVTLTQIEEEE